MFRVVRHGAYGVVVALFMQLLPWVRSARANVVRRMHTLSSNMMLVSNSRAPALPRPPARGALQICMGCPPPSLSSS